ncbi:MAG: CHAT domain-containing protein, partial [Cyclobacteriaceae bacterium]|nr:CHAT domain-containing protein [Cyclobacteriaceae bacterium]
GVYGLQRALRVAGAQNMIMSLWKVDDEATQKLMVDFYTRWIKTSDMRSAFRAAQKNLRKKYPNPYYWGAFILAR